MRAGGRTDPLRERARKSATRAAVRWDGGEWTYAEWDRAADRVASSLREGGFGPGDTVAAVLRRDTESLAALFGVSRAGAVLAPVDDTWGDREWERFLSAVAPVAILGSGTRSSTIGPRSPTRPGSELSKTHTLLWTSGTAGTPRGVRLTLSNHLSSARAVARRLGLREEHRWLVSLPLTHVGGLGIVFRAILTGARLVLLETFDAAELTRLVRAARITHLSLVPTMLHQVVETGQADRLRELECVLIGGAACPPSLLARALKAGVPVALTYGLTEACSQVATAPPERVRQKPGTVGRPLDGTGLRLTEQGEILVSGPTVMQGYLTETAADSPWFGSWLRTGDLGRLDDEGDLWVTGRLGSRIVTGGTNVDPQEVERVLTGHPGVEEAVVIGLPDPVWGEIVTAVVLPREDTRLEERQLVEFSRDELSGPKRPRRWLLVESLPRTSSGKPDREAVRRVVRGPGDNGEQPEKTC